MGKRPCKTASGSADFCGRRGYLTLDKDGKITYSWPEDNRNRLTMMGKFDHVREIERHTAERYEPHKDELKRYRQMEQFTVKAPSKQK